MATRRVIPGGVLLVSSLLAAVVLGAQVGQQPTGGRVSGTVVVAATGRPVANARVQYQQHQVADANPIVPHDQQDNSVQTTVTDAAGQFTFPPSRLGVVTVTASGFGTAQRRWPPRRGRTLEVALTPPVAVQGTVVDYETLRPLVGVVTALVQHPDNVVSTSAVVEDGTFRFEDLPLASGLVVAYAGDHAPAVGRFTTAVGDRVDVHLRLSRGATVTGQVLDAAAKPVAGAQLIVRYTDTLPEAVMLANFIGGITMTGSDGEFALTGLVPHTPVILYAEHDGQQTNTVTIEVEPGQARPDLVLRLPER